MNNEIEGTHPIKTKEDYLKLFDGDYNKTSKRKKALEYALDIRKFEIGLYWARAKYFWTLITVTFGGFLVTLGKNLEQESHLTFILLTVLSSIGLVLSLAWHKANKGSKSWQENWENHVDLLEDDVIGPLYKTVILRSPSKDAGKANSFIDDLTEPERISVSKVNQLVSLYVCWAWGGFLVYSFVLSFIFFLWILDLIVKTVSFLDEKTTRRTTYRRTMGTSGAFDPEIREPSYRSRPSGSTHRPGRIERRSLGIANRCCLGRSS